MQLKPSYVPKEKKKVNYKIVVPFIIVSAVLFYFALDKLLPEKKVDKGYSICNLSGKESAKLVSKREYPQNIELSDYAQYGESLALYHEEFQFGTQDKFSGKTIFLNNLCHDDERAYMMDAELDRKLPMNELDDGFYELEILEGLDRFFLFSEETLNDTFYTMTRDGFHKKIDVVADKEMFKHDEETVTDLNYVYLNVETIKDTEDEYDIIIDPAALNENDQGYVYYGYSKNGMTESDYTYNIAAALEEKLTAKGMKVKLTRDNETAKNFSGEGGRLDDAYASGAKYFLSLAFPSSGSKNDFGTTVLYSSYASNTLATDVRNSLVEHSKLESSNWSGGNDVDGVYPSGRKDNFDRTIEIRETGGMSTGAGFVTENPYGKENRRGMEAVYVELGFMTNENDYQAVHNDIDGIADAIAKAIFKNLGM